MGPRRRLPAKGTVQPTLGWSGAGAFRRLLPRRRVGCRPAPRGRASGSFAADAPGLERDLTGLTLLEAAAVPGETLAADALANAIGPAVAAPAVSGRVAVAMSGGVDSAVALLKAGPDAVGVTLRLWIDPNGPDDRARLLLAARRDRRARGLPRPRPPARHARPARGVPPRRRRAVRSRLRARGDAEPVRPLQRQLPLRRAARVRRAHRRGAARDRPLRADRRARRPPPARARGRPGRRTRATCSPRSTKPRSSGCGSRSASRRRSRPAPRPRRPGSRPPRGPRARRRASSAATTTASSSCATAFASEPGAVVDEDGQRARHPRRLLALHARPAPRSRHRRRRAALRARLRRSHEHRRRRPARVARADARRGARPPARAPHVVSRRSSATARPPSAPRSTPTPDGFALELDEPAFGVAPGQVAVLYDGRRDRRVGRDPVGRCRLRSPDASRLHLHGRRLRGARRSS